VVPAEEWERKTHRRPTSPNSSWKRPCAVRESEVRYGVERPPAGERRDRLDIWLTEQVPLVRGRRLAVDAETANVWGRVMAQGQAAGHPPGMMGAFTAATVLRHESDPRHAQRPGFRHAGGQARQPVEQCPR
jgi:predicted nucleic acid-binding protein